MTTADDFRGIVARLRSWGFDISETSGCYSRSNGLAWAQGRPVGHVQHHYVCSLNPAQTYINSLVNGLMNGSTVNWFADVNGRGYLIGVGPMNHAGTGNSSVLSRTRNRQAPLGPSSSAGDMTGNTWYSGTELQHPGDSTPYPQPMVDLMVAIAAATALQFGWSADQVIDHFEWTGRKIDMSLWGGRATSAGTRMRTAVAARMAGGTPPPLELNPEDDEMTMIVKRDPATGVDYFYNTHVFTWCPSAGHYNNMLASGLIDVPHGKAEKMDTAMLGWIAGQIENFGGKVERGPHLPKP